MPIGEGVGPRLRFGRFEFDPAAGELCRDGESVRLQEQPRQVLAALLARPGEIVTREELRERLWKGDTFVDFEHGLNTAIKKVRQALGDTADDPQFVETLARRGYRFVAPVALKQPQPPVPEAAPTNAVLEQHHPTLFPGARVLLTVLLLIAIGAAAWIARRPAASTERSTGTPAQLAVLPLRVLAADGDRSTYLGIGIADAITTRLANVRQIAVRPTSAVLAYKEGVAESARVAAALGVQHLLLGTIQEAENAYRVSVQLVRRDGVAVWGRTYDLPRTGLLRLQDDVAEQVVTALRVELSAPERARLRAVTHTPNPAAYDIYLRGRTLLLNYTETNMREAIRRFEEALTLDADYAVARAALATACAWFSVRYAYESEAIAWGKRAEAEARRALEEDSSLGEAHLAIGSAAGTLYRGFDWSTVMTESATALALDPTLELAHIARMRAFYHLGAFDNARAEARRARALNPTPNTELARLEVAVELFAGNFKMAADQAAALLRRTDAPAVRHYLGLARYYLKDVAGAREILAGTMRGGKPDVRAQASLASIEAAAGLRKEARARSLAVERGPYMDHHVAYSLGAAWAQIGDTTASIRWLQQAVDTGFACPPWFARDTLLDPMRSEPRFKELMAKLDAHAVISSRR
jgi:DNA-binding winged helix-turn-helix (wHTH) protein/TolB-like protein